jgi:hypothetical protein
MRYAINLNLDYDTHPFETVRSLFREVRANLIAAGFRRDGRLFTIDLPGPEARALARQVLETSAREGGYGEVYPYVKEFYGFDFEQAVNLLLPSAGAISVEELGEVTDFEVIQLSVTTKG